MSTTVGMLGEWARVSLGVVLLSLPACSVFEPIDEPEVSDVQLTVDTLRTSLRDAKRTITELREEAEARRQELADVQIARAQLDGRLREAERRLAEARQIVDLQREELADSRSEREQVAKTGAALQSQMKQLQKQVAKMRRGANSSAAPTAVVPSGEPSGLASGTLEPPASVPFVQESTGLPTATAVHRPDGLSVSELPTVSSVMGTPVRILVKPGDTLWGIARRYHRSVNRLKVMNVLLDDRIRVGQVLWLTETVESEQ